MKAYGGEAGEGYMPDCQLGKKRNELAGGKGQTLGLVKTGLRARPLFQAG